MFGTTPLLNSIKKDFKKNTETGLASLYVCLCVCQVDNKGNHLLVHEESSINVPAIAAAHVIKRYIAQASDELSFEVTAAPLNTHTHTHTLLVHYIPWSQIEPIDDNLSASFCFIHFHLACCFLQVGDIVSVIDMPPKEDTTWWRGKHGFQVHSIPSTHIYTLARDPFVFVLQLETYYSVLGKFQGQGCRVGELYFVVQI